jgi:plastocyanin
MKRTSVLAVALALAVFGLAACGDDDDGGDDTTAAETTTTEATDTAAAAGGAGGTVDLAAPADGAFAYEPSSANTAAGPVTVNFDNPSSLSHDVVIESDSGDELGKTDLISQGNTSVTVDLAPGTYTYYCDVPGHQEGGMEGTLTVK